MEALTAPRPGGAALILKPPAPLSLKVGIPAIFLAGSIEQGTAADWQSEVMKALADREVILLSPRRDHWDPTWRQSKDEPHFRGQVEWELEGQERADKIIMYFDPATKSPITLLELGLFAQSGKLIVCCPDGFWRKGNVEIVCERYGIPIVDTLRDLTEYLKAEYPR